ncbi:hypothetical protein OTERR_19920 [Oryzomicrobium terrae]|uniref:HD-GYP domain-containing protein n=1 Tax=Oryzomicrobium terrae TaxID=1735038 RepID=A0A5C1EB56_9RHOO|nr:HD domain-containing phosphohydrolase [Oryzomicrobium terrae]QEL65468.1 hypothetical protein OTERR_19920 [Oryzomicrobium terrae]
MLAHHFFELISVPVLLFAIFVLADSFSPRLPAWLPRYWVQVAVYAVLAVLSLQLSFKIDNGVYIDTRNGVMAVATIALGPLGGFIVSLAGAATRLNMGGGGAIPGSLSILSAWALATLVLAGYRRIAPHGRATASPLVLLLAGIGGGLASMASLSWIAFHRGESPDSSLLTMAATAQVVSALLLGGLIHLTVSRSAALAAGRQANASLRQSLRQTIGSLAAAALHRDPASATHQQRVAHLAVAVGRKLGLPAEQLEGLELACLVHDVGQIEVPGEILSRPGPLTPAEYELIKLHSVIGYEILKDVDFPWPIAEIVYQHHENLDGTGYPRGLAGEAICREARILRVCDIVESMSSHRVFRPEFGAERALREIERMAGKELDPQVVAACTALFRQDHYTLPKP